MFPRIPTFYYRLHASFQNHEQSPFTFPSLISLKLRNHVNLHRSNHPPIMNFSISVITYSWTNGITLMTCQILRSLIFFKTHLWIVHAQSLYIYRLLLYIVSTTYVSVDTTFYIHPDPFGFLPFSISFSVHTHTILTFLPSVSADFLLLPVIVTTFQDPILNFPYVFPSPPV